MKICIVGGQLQGLEVAYLARQAKYNIGLIDKDPLAPARTFADEFFEIDILGNKEKVVAVLKNYDLILPATENYPTLVRLKELAVIAKVPLALDLSSYTVSASKIESNRLFQRAGIDMPEPWPDCGFPVIVKPSGLSGSKGVIKVTNQSQLTAVLARLGSEVVIQKYLPGPSYSLEVIADKGLCLGLQVTELNFDAGYDCKRVLAGPNTGMDVAQAFYDLGAKLAAALNLSGIMDIEVIDDNGELKVLEIDARFPSQTPSAVFHSTGINMVELLADYWLKNQLPPLQGLPYNPRAVIYEHLKFKDGVLEVSGEGILTGAQGLKVYQAESSNNIFISNFEDSPNNWVATVIYSEETEEKVWESRNREVRNLMKVFNARGYLDPYPINNEH